MNFLKDNFLPVIRKKNTKRIQFFFGILLSFACLAWVFKELDFPKFFEAIKSANPLLILCAIVLTILSYLIRSCRWPFFFKTRKLSFYDSYRCLILGFFMNNVLPARIGELVRAHVGGKATRESRAVVLATVAGERLADGITISLFFVVLFTIGGSALELSNGAKIYYVCYLFAFAALFTATLLLFRQRIFVILERFASRCPGHLPTYSFTKIRLFIEGLEPLFRLKSAAIITIFSLLVWSVELFVYYAISRAFNQNLNLAGVVLFLAAVNFSSLIPAFAGGIGTIEAFTTLSLSQIGIDWELALAMVITQHVIQILVVGIPGAFFFFTTMGGRMPKTVEVAEDSQTLDSTT